jgi:hypothetical protein
MKKLIILFTLLTIVLLSGCIGSNTGIQTTSQPTTIVLSACPFEVQLRELIGRASDDFLIPYGNASEFFNDIDDIDKTQGYSFGYASKIIGSDTWICSFPPSGWGYDRSFHFSCRNGSRVGENKNYLYCNEQGEYSNNLLIGKDIISPDGTIQNKIRIIISKLTIDSKDSNIIELKCEKITCSE